MGDSPPPSSILIVGAGVFGLSTALALLSSPRYAHTHITILDARTPTSFPHANPPTASIDSSRIVRADYAVPAYAALATSAQTLWRQDWGGKGVYRECGLAFTAHRDGGAGEGYVRKSLENVRALEGDAGGNVGVRQKDGGAEASGIEYLPDRRAIGRVMRGTGGCSGDWGYVNWRSGWVDAEAAIEETRRRIRDLAETRGGLAWIFGTADRLLFSSADPSATASVTGVLLSPARPLLAALTILATGAWSPLLLPLSPRLIATGQIIAYIQLSQAEAHALSHFPVLLNESNGMFLIPPTPSGLLKIARHGFGYRNPVRVPHPERPDSGERIGVSVPAADFDVLPAEGVAALRAFVRDMVPWLAGRAFASTRVCWYADTPTGDFLVDYVPQYGKSLLVATGGSGHGFKFLPVLGEKVVARVEGRLEGELGMLWGWGEGREGFEACEDGSRGGKRGMVWGEEVGRGRRGGGESKL